MQNLIAASNTLTMSSREIADLVQKRHDNVKRTIESLAARGVIESPQTEEISTATKPGTAYVFTGEKGKRDSIVVVAQLHPEFTARLVDRWQELEQQAAAPAIPQTLPEALRLAADLAEQNGALQRELIEQAPKVDVYERIADAAGTLCLTDIAKHLGVKRKALLLWMSENRWIYHRTNSKRWLAYQPRLASGVLVHRIKTLGTDEHGDERVATQVRVTPKGLTALAKRVPRPSGGM